MLKDIKPVKVNFNLRNTTPVDKETSIHCIIRYNKERIVLSNVESIQPRFWNINNQRARTTSKFPEASSLNSSLDSKEVKIKELYRSFTTSNNTYPSVATFRDLCKKALNGDAEAEKKGFRKHDLFSFLELFIEESLSGKRLSAHGSPIAPNTIKIYRTFKANLLDFKAKTGYNLGFDNIGLEFFEDFKEYMTFGRQYSTNTVAKHIRTIKTVLGDARDRGLTTNEFKGKRYQAKTEATETIYLNGEELEILYSHDFSNKLKLDRVRDLFIIGCWTGLRFSDFSVLSKAHIKDSYIEIKTKKTGARVVIPIHPYVARIMEKYQDTTENSLPAALSNQKMNEYLKKIGEEARILGDVQIEYTKAGRKITKTVPKYSLISTHTARRSFATNAYKAGIPSLSIMAITGHRTESAFMKYIKVTPTEHAAKILEHWNRENLKIAHG